MRTTQAFATGVSGRGRGHGRLGRRGRRLRPQGPLEPPFATRLPVRPFPANLEWLNVARPVDLGQLRGHFVLLDFWTLGCINCMHIIPELRKLEKAWGNELVVIGVHSAKFAERTTDRQNIREAVLRYGIQHPVVNDSQFVVWNSFDVQAWPTLVLIDPEGFAVWGHSGEVTFAAGRRRAPPRGPVSTAATARSTDKPPPLETEAAKAAADAAAVPRQNPGRPVRRAAVHRRQRAQPHRRRRGSTARRWPPSAPARPARPTAAYAAAEFNSPQGMALDGDALYVADTWNHLIRRVDLAAGG